MPVSRDATYPWGGRRESHLHHPLHNSSVQPHYDLTAPTHTPPHLWRIFSVSPRRERGASASHSRVTPSTASLRESRISACTRVRACALPLHAKQCQGWRGAEWFSCVRHQCLVLDWQLSSFSIAAQLTPHFLLESIAAGSDFFFFVASAPVQHFHRVYAPKPRDHDHRPA
ncbi:hypothetical protein C8R44DRAFT_974296 [Mycena epipterygia]|nr:hypothetical protein C8R44DRAFT_974296 [Mycena epipterygia]